MSQLDISHNFDRLLSEQIDAIEQSDKKISKLEKYKEDYHNLISKLTGLVQNFTWKAIIPFSPKAFVHGTLIHTNEVLVHLGGTDEFFAECSVADAVCLLKSRILRIDVHIELINNQRQLLSNRRQFTSGLAAKMNPSSLDSVDEYVGSEVEIREEFDQENEIKWKESHKQSILKKMNLNPCRTSKSRRRVKFSDEHNSPIDDSDSLSSSTESAYSSLICIHFHHSDLPSPPVLSELIDLNNASPRDVCDFFVKNDMHDCLPLDLFTTNSVIAEVIEHPTQLAHDILQTTVSVDDPVKGVSKFRALRNAKFQPN